MWRDEANLLDMLIWARRAARYSRGLDLDAFKADPLVQDATIRCITVIGEAAARLSDEFRADNPGLGLPAIIGMRNRLVHAYGVVDLNEVWAAATRDCPRLIDELARIVPPEAPQSSESD